MTRHTVSLPVPAAGRTAVRRFVEPLAFWGAVLLPLAHIALLYGGLPGGQLRLFFGLVAVNVACLVLGHGHRT